MKQETRDAIVTLQKLEKVLNLLSVQRRKEIIALFSQLRKAPELKTADQSLRISYLVTELTGKSLVYHQGKETVIFPKQKTFIFNNQEREYPEVVCQNNDKFQQLEQLFQNSFVILRDMNDETFQKCQARLETEPRFVTFKKAIQKTTDEIITSVCDEYDPVEKSQPTKTKQSSPQKDETEDNEDRFLIFLLNLTLRLGLVKINNDKPKTKCLSHCDNISPKTINQGREQRS